MNAAPATDSAPVVRFAPSPTGRLHLGHAHSALFCRQQAGRRGRVLLRIEDIDRARCRAAFEQGIYEDLDWLGLAWERPVWRQSARMAVYSRALEQLRALGVIYPCFCSRKEIRAEAARLGAAPHGPLGAPYPGTCRGLTAGARAARITAGEAYSLRLDHRLAHRRVGTPVWHDRRLGRQRADLTAIGDVMLARKEVAASYHLAVTVDDAAQGITLVTRGEDLLPATPVHRMLQALLALPVPEWHHHGLLQDAQGRRLAKRDDARAIASLRAAGHSPAEVRALAGFPD